jgi:hypothetical protein
LAQCESRAQPQGGIFRQALGRELLMSAKLRLEELAAAYPPRSSLVQLTTGRRHTSTTSTARIPTAR